MMDIENYLDIHESARLLSIHEESLRRLIRLGSLPAEKIGGQWFIDKDQLALFATTYDARTGKRKKLL